MKSLLALAVLLIPAAGVAQSITNPQPTMNMPNYSTFSSSVEGRDQLPPPRESEAVRKEKLARALALREEALVLEARDGGRLSAGSQAYLRRKAQTILAYR